MIGSLREKRNNTGIFKSAYMYDTTDQNNAYLLGDLYFDFDSEIFEHTRQDTLKAISFLKVVFHIEDTSQIKIYFSGNKGFHIVVDYDILGVKPIKHLNLTYKYIAEDLNSFINNGTLDLRVYDNKRMFRVEGSKHEKSGLYKTYITYDELLKLTEDEIKEISKIKREEPVIKKNFNNKAHATYKFYDNKAITCANKIHNIKSKGTLKYEPPCITNILEHGAVSGKRNNTVAVLSSYLNSSGKDLEQALDILLKWNEDVNATPLSRHEITNTCKSIYRGCKSFGCSSIKSLDLCMSENCKFKK